MQVGLPNVGKSTFFNIVTKMGSRAGDSRPAVKKSKAEDPNKPKLPRVPSSSSCESQSWFLVLLMLLLWCGAA
uniref:G domain-containing protein n=1 Tax=Triticum urartu TaxID=4572 RepID=A0A8R7K3D5_TRIUA